jgi:hypothetical protein
MLHKEETQWSESEIGISTQVAAATSDHRHIDSESREISSEADFVGISGSLLCLVHCLAPQLISLGILGAGIGTFFSGEIWAGLFWITCLWAVRKAAADAPFPISAFFLWFSFSTFSLGLGMETFFGADKIISYSGSLLLILAHLNNYRLQRKAANLFSRLRHDACCGRQH